MSKLNMLIIFGISIALGILIAMGYVYLLNLFIKRRLSDREQIRITSLESIDKLLRKSKKHPLDEVDIYNIWSEFMNYISTTNSSLKAEHYKTEIELILGRRGEPLLEKSETLIKEKFHIGGKESYSLIKS